uniref:CYtochrome P450 family n=1 Tax=Acrobeloides nanus TaxID=290746 RepID=A0A914DPZ1_9BILA
MLMWKHIGWMKNLPYFSSLAKQIEENRDILYTYFDEHINQHKAEIDLDADNEPKDYVEAFLKEQHRRERSGDEAHYFNQTQLINMCFDLWLAGQETTSLTIELDEMIGSDRMVEENDKNLLKYTCAVVNEAQRVANIISHNLLHKTSKDVVIDGHFIPKGTSIVPQMSVVMYDDEVFPEPEKFKPERFLDEAGNLKKVDELIPFSVGKRQCLGEGLAKMEIYLLIANLCNQFEFYSINGKEPTTKRRCGQTVGPYPFVCGIRMRK